MSGWLLDTNVISELSSASPAAQVVAWAAARDERRLFLSVLTLAEYDKGIANLPPDHAALPRIEASLRALESRFAGRILPLSDAVVRRWGHVAGATRRRTGHPPPVIDTMLAATAIEHGLVLVTRNVRDVRESGVRWLDPWSQT